MSIKTWKEGDQVHYLVKVNSRTKVDRTQIHRQTSGTLVGLDDEAVRKKLQRVEQQLYGDVRAEAALRDGAGILWEDLIGRWKKEVLFDKDAMEIFGLGPKTGSGYLQALLDHTDAWFKRPASEITSADFELLAVAMRKVGYAENTLGNVKSAVNCCYKWGIKKRLIPRVSVSPTFGCTVSKKKNKRRPEILNFTQICTLIERAQAENHPWYPIWKSVLYTGFRSGEAYELRRKDLCREEKRIVIDEKYDFGLKIVNQLKDHEWRQVPINQELDKFFEELGVWDLEPEAYVFPRIKEWKSGRAAEVLRNFCEKIHIPSICFHTLRACWATQLLRNGESQTKVMIMGGWADLETMQSYLRRAGVEIEGGTDSLRFVRNERPGRILKVLPGNSVRDQLENVDDSE